MPNILLVEDDEALRLELKRAIEHEGHCVTGAEDLSKPVKPCEEVTLT